MVGYAIMYIGMQNTIAKNIILTKNRDALYTAMSTIYIEMRCDKSCQQFQVEKEILLFKFKFTQKFIKNYDDDSDKGYILKVDASCSKRLQKKHSDPPQLLERMKIKKYQKFVCNMYGKKNYVVHIKALRCFTW